MQVYYIPPGDVKMQKLTKDPRHKTFCEWKVLTLCQVNTSDRPQIGLGCNLGEQSVLPLKMCAMP